MKKIFEDRPEQKCLMPAALVLVAGWIVLCFYAGWIVI